MIILRLHESNIVRVGPTPDYWSNSRLLVQLQIIGPVQARSTGLSPPALSRMTLKAAFWAAPVILGKIQLNSTSVLF